MDLGNDEASSPEQALEKTYRRILIFLAIDPIDTPTTIQLVNSFMGCYRFGKMPREDSTSYWSRSPLSLVGNVSTPTVGTEDFRTPPSESEQFYQALQLRGVPTALLKMPGASHEGLAERPSQSAAKAGSILAGSLRALVMRTCAPAPDQVRGHDVLVARRATSPASLRYGGEEKSSRALSSHAQRGGSGGPNS